MSHKCAYKNCMHESKEIEPCDEVQVGKRYMHSDCAAIYSAIQKAEFLFKTEINPSVSIKDLRIMIHNYIFKQNTDPEYLCFAIKWAKRNANITYPAGLKYVLENVKCKDSWNKKKADMIVKQMKPVKVRPTETFSYTPEQPTTLLSILA